MPPPPLCATHLPLSGLWRGLMPAQYTLPPPQIVASPWKVPLPTTGRDAFLAPLYRHFHVRRQHGLQYMALDTFSTLGPATPAPPQHALPAFNGPPIPLPYQPQNTGVTRLVTVHPAAVLRRANATFSLEPGS